MVYQKNGKIIRRWSGKPGNIQLGWLAASPTLCIHRRVYEKHGPMSEKFPVAGDYDYQIRIFGDKCLKFVSIPEPLVVYYAGGASNGGVKANLNGIKESLAVLKNNKSIIKFPLAALSGRIITAFLAYAFASRKQARPPIGREKNGN